MNDRNGFKSHPLDMNNLDEEKRFYSYSSNNHMNMNKPAHHINEMDTESYGNQQTNYNINNFNHNNNNNTFLNTSNCFSQATSTDSKPKVPKRRLPKIPDKLIPNNDTVFLRQTSNSNPINFLIDIDDVRWLYKLENLEANSSNFVPNVSMDDTADKWLFFNKLDSTSLEVEYRSFQSRKSFDSKSQPNLVQVLDDLYEVNLLTKKCQTIYWKGKMI